MLPFIVCFIVLISYVEDVFALINENYMLYDGSVALNKPLSWWIGSFFEYNLITVVILLTISVAVETCYWNKIAILYLSIQLVEKDYFANVEVYPSLVFAVAIVNILISGFLVWKGIMTLNKG